MKLLEVGLCYRDNRVVALSVGEETTSTGETSGFSKFNHILQCNLDVENLCCQKASWLSAEKEQGV